MVAGLDDPSVLETFACREGLALAEDLNLHNFVIASDSKQTIADINQGTRGGNGSIVHEISLRASLFHCNFTFERRAINVDAHRLAKYSLTLGQGRHIWLGQPHDPNCIPHLVAFDE